jgi:hypothetical protein
VTRSAPGPQQPAVATHRVRFARQRARRAGQPDGNILVGGGASSAVPH